VLRSIIRGRMLATLAVAALAVPFAAAQERGEHITGSITSVDGRNLVVKSDDGREIRIRVTPSTEVYFQDSGDRKLFPNPGIDDLRSGMGVNFNYNDGTPSRVVVHYVPAGFVRSGPAETPLPTGGAIGGSGQQVKARVQSVTSDGRQLTADVAGKSRRYLVQDRREAQGLNPGDMVILTVSGGTVTRIDSADLTGVLRRLDERARTVTIDVDGREETYSVDDRNLLQDLREGDRVRFEVEERSGGRRVVTGIQRRTRVR
jgi:outer membrane lipoprotein SlyB